MDKAKGNWLAKLDSYTPRSTPEDSGSGRLFPFKSLLGAFRV